MFRLDRSSPRHSLPGPSGACSYVGHVVERELGLRGFVVNRSNLRHKVRRSEDLADTEPLSKRAPGARSGDEAGRLAERARLGRASIVSITSGKSKHGEFCNI